jgi:hypothetical protein
MLKKSLPKYTERGSENNFKNSIVDFSSSEIKVLPKPVIAAKKITIQYKADNKIGSISLLPIVKYIKLMVIKTKRKREDIAYLVLYSDFKSFFNTINKFIF